jgi:ABC-type spermidine/putrescine transport system permease subunit I
MTGPATVGDHLTAENYLNFTDFFYFRILLNTFWLGRGDQLPVIGYPVSYFSRAQEAVGAGFAVHGRGATVGERRFETSAGFRS